MKYIILIFAFLVTGCATVSVPVKAKFPAIPDTLVAKCPELEKIQDDAKLSDMIKIISKNYTSYHECALKHDAIIEWYKVQKTIYESSK